MNKLTLKELTKIANINRQRDYVYNCNKAKLSLLKLCIVADALMDLPEYEYIADIDAKYTEDETIIATYSDLECLSVYFNTTLQYLYFNENLKGCSLLTDCKVSFNEVVKYVTLQQKIDGAVLLHLIKYLSLDYKMNTTIAKRARHYIEDLKLSNHTYQLTGKNINGINRTLDKALKTIIDLELKKHDKEL